MAQISTTKCDLCERDTGKLFCYECRHFLCQSCRNIHDKIQKKHTVTDSHNVDRLALSKQLTCEEHKENFVHFCLRCECFICSSCVTTGHRGHSLTQISEVVSRARENVKANIDKLKKKIKTLTDLIEPIKATKLKKQDESEHFSSEVEKTSEHIISIVNSVKEIDITRASDFIVLEKLQLEFTIAKLEKVYNEHASVSSQLEQLNFNNKYGFKKLKPKQMDIIVHLVNRRNVFAVLPTGYGKSLCFGLPSLILDKLETHRRHICLVISPLRSLMMNQVQAWSKKGISSAIWGRKEEMDDSVKTEITNGNISIVFSSPESILSPAGLDLLRSKEYKEGLCLIAFDEVHCITEWGDDFRPKYKEVSLLRSLASNVPVGMFTATCTEKIMEDVLSHLLLNNKPVESVALLPDRPNLMLNIKKASQFEKEIDWYITNLKTNGQKAPKAIIYCRSMTHAAEIYAHILHSIGEAAWLNIDKHDPCRRLVDVYHRSSLPEDQHRVTTEFPKEDSVIRCIIATIAFGMGVDIDDIRYIFHWGCSKSPLSYWQEIGRCSRDGQLGSCFLYLPPHALDPRRVDESMIAICKDNSLCIRRELLQHLVITGMDITELKDMKFRASCSKNCTNCKCSLCMCCSRCKEQCTCQLTTI